MLIFGRFNCICTASGIVTLCERPYVTLVNREFSFNHCNIWSLTESDGTSFCIRTASGTVTLCERPYIILVKGEFCLNQCNVQPLTESDGTRCCTYTKECTVTLCERPYATMVKREFSLNQCNVQLLTESYGTSFVYVYVYVQHLVPSLTVSGCTLHWLRQNSPLTSVMYGRSQRVTVPDALHIQLNLLKMSIIMLETCRRL